MEKWEEIYKYVIPVRKYQVSVKNGEESGLIIYLESNTNAVSINFGLTDALRMLEEGILLNEIFRNNAIEQIKKIIFKTLYH